MNPNTMMMITGITGLLVFICVVAAGGLDTILSDEWPSNGQKPTDEQIIQQTLHSLTSLYSDTTNLDKCQRCKSTLDIGKAIALTNPELVAPIFIKWCEMTKLGSAATCKNTYSRHTVEASRSGSDFANVLQLMDPWSVDGDYLCHFKMKSQCPLPELPTIDLSSWWPAKPESHMTAPTPGNETFNVLHVSDFHIELDYTLGSEANCTTSGMCCNPHSWNKNAKPDSIDNSDLRFFDSYYTDEGVFQLGEDITSEVYNSSVWTPAQEFGFYQCDSPELLINSSLKSIVDYQLNNSMEFDFVIFTGDMVDHDEQEHISYQSTIESQEHVLRDLKNYFKDVPVYPVLGNHDTFPYGQLASEASGHKNLYEWNDELMASIWIGNGWIPFDDYDQIKKHYTGYSIQTKRGLKVIALNSNSYYTANYYNYWNMTDGIDQFGTLKFLVDELLESEAQGQRVWVIAHVPPNTQTLPTQAEAYKQIYSRFSPSTIAGLFFGHTHQDQFTMLYANDNKTIEDAIMNTWIIQSVTPWVGFNPGWRYYEVDTETFSIMNSMNFYTKLNETFGNDGAEPVWEFEYSAREAYDPQSTWPADAPLNATFWATVAESIKKSNETAQLYSDFAYRLSPFAPDCSDGECKENYCYVSSFGVNEYEKCAGEGSIDS